MRSVAATAIAVWSPASARAAKDCMLDCSQNCNLVALGSKDYCEATCVDYCAQDDRRDGLSGSVSAEGGEIGWSSAYDFKSRATGAISTVPYGEDRPPALPDLFGINKVLRDTVQGKK